MRLLLWIPLFCMKNNLIFTSEQWQDHYLHQGLICAILRVFPENLGFEIWSKLFFFLFLGAKSSKENCSMKVLQVLHATPRWFYFRLAEGWKLEARPAALQLLHTPQSQLLLPSGTARSQQICRLENQPLRLAQLLPGDPRSLPSEVRGALYMLVISQGACHGKKNNSA